MTIQDNPSAGSVSPNSPRGDGPDQARDVSPSDEAQSSESNAGRDASASDRVEISDEARAAQSEIGDNAALIERGRAALESSSLSASRLSELRDNVESGRYLESDVTEQVAQGLAEDLSRPTPGSN
jgi:hypothetical protein